jgi:hypothetical protein
MATCSYPDGSDGAVNFLRFNCEIFGAPDSKTGNPLLDWFRNTLRDVQTTGEVQGFETPGSVISQAWPYLFAIAGLILFGMLLWGSMEVMFGAATPKSAEAGKQRITNAIIGFVLLFCVFWIGQIIQQIFGLNFLGTATGTPTP